MTSPTLFMTGADGFLGKRLLRLFLDQGCSCYLLVQDKFFPSTQKWVQTLSPADQQLVSLFKGDITQKNLGLDQQEIQKIHREVEFILHMAAAYDLKIPQSLGMSINVGGTENVLAFAKKCRSLKKFGYLSTTAISGNYSGVFRESDFDVGQKFKNFYEYTKFMAEKKVREARSNLPVTIFRPTIIIGDSRTGEMEKLDGPYFGIRMILKKKHFILPKSGKVKCHVEPVDFVVRAIHYLMNQPQTISQTFHLADPQPLTYDEFFDSVIANLKTFSPFLKPPAKMMAPFFYLPVTQWLTGVPQESFRYTLVDVNYDSAESQKMLHPAGVQCPPIAHYLNIILDFFRQKEKNHDLQKGKW